MGTEKLISWMLIPENGLFSVLEIGKWRIAYTYYTLYNFTQLFIERKNNSVEGRTLDLMFYRLAQVYCSSFKATF